MRFGERLRRRRKELGLRQEQVGQQIGVSQPTVAKWENGKVLPDPDSFGPLAAFFEVADADVVHWVYGAENDMATRISRLEEQMTVVLQELRSLSRRLPGEPESAG